MFLRLARLLFGNSEDIDLDPALGRMGPAEIHSYSAEDFEACRELYVINEPGRFPVGFLPDFEASLRDGTSLFLVVKKEKKICGCAGISLRIEPSASVAWLGYGLIHPEHQGQGLGATLLLARLSLLSAEVRWAAMAPVSASRGYYERFNFRQIMRHRWPNGVELPIHRVRLPARNFSHCANLLANAGVILTLNSSRVPVHSPEQKAASAS